MKRRLLVPAVLAAALCSLAPTPGLPRNGRLLKVDPTEPTAFQTIAQAVSAARQFDTIGLSAAGSPYHECVDIERRFDLRITSIGDRVTIDATGECPASEPAFKVALSRHVIVENVDLRGNPGGAGFLVDHAGDVRFRNVTASGFDECGLVSTLSVVGLFVDLSRFTDNPGGGLCLNGNGLWITGTTTDRNGQGGIVLQGVPGGVALNAFVARGLAGSDQPAGITAQSPGGLNNLVVTRSTFGARGVPPRAGARGIAGAGARLDVSGSLFHGVGIETSAGGGFSGNVVSDCVGAGFALGPGPLGAILSANTVQRCAGPGFDLDGAYAYRNRALGNAGDGFLARDGAFLDRNTASGSGGSGFARVGTDNGGRANVSTDPVPADFR